MGASLASNTPRCVVLISHTCHVSNTKQSHRPSYYHSFIDPFLRSFTHTQVFASLGVPTALLCREEAFLPFLPEELRGAIKAEMARDGIQVIHSDVQTFAVDDDGKGGAGKQVRFAFEDGGTLAVDLCLYSGGRDANSEKIGCENVGVGIGKYGRVLVDRDFRTANPRIFAIGDVVGPPGLASFAQQAARVVTDLLFRTEEEEEAAEEEAAKRKKKKEAEAEANKYAGALSSGGMPVCPGQWVRRSFPSSSLTYDTGFSVGTHT